MIKLVVRIFIKYTRTLFYIYKGSSVSEFEPRLATEVPTVESGFVKDREKTCISPIRKDVKFHNGDVLTPKNVEDCFERGLLYDLISG